MVRGPYRGQPSVQLRELRVFCNRVVMRFMAYISDTRVKTMTDVGSVSVVHEFRDVIPEELVGVPLERQV